MDTTPPAAPSLTTPVNAASVIGTPKFTWTAPATASKYQFEYDNDANFSTPTYTSAELTVTNLTPPTMALGTYSWHVRAKDAAGNWGAWSAPSTINIIPVVPSTPALISPINGSINPNPAPTLTWASVPYGTSYDVQMDNNSTFSSPEFSDRVSATHAAPAKLPDGVYYWHVRAVNALGGTSGWSSTWRLTISQPLAGIPTLLLPADASSNATGLPTFTWSSVANGNTYQIQVDNDSDFSSSEFDDTAATTSRTPGTALADGVYSWRVRAANPYNTYGDWSVVRTLTVSIPPAAPSLTGPDDASTDSTGTPTFTWESITNGNTYQIQVDNDSDFSSPEFDDTAATTSRTTGARLADGIYSWRVRAIDLYSTPGAWSIVRTVKIDVPPAAPTITAPDDAATDTTGTLAFTWESMPNARNYQFQVDNNSDFSSPEVDDTAATTSRTPALADGVYSWRVRATNLYDTPGDWSLPRTITIDVPPEIPVLTSPADGATDTTGTPTFTWEAATNGTTYQIQVDNDSDFSSPEFDDTAATTNRTPALANGVYYWRVRAVTINGTPGAWSTEGWTLTIAQ